MGMQVPPEGWGDHVWTVDKVELLAATLLNDSVSNGFMLWSMHKHNKGEHAVLTGTDIPITTDALAIFAYAKSIGYEAECINPDTQQPLALQWAPQHMTWRINFWLDSKGMPLCSAAP